jgi:ankyrin repeat protein
MSKYFDKKIISDIGQKIVKPSIDDETKNLIFSNISSGNYQILYDIITPNIILTFVDNDNNSVTHRLVSVNNKLIPEETKLILLNFFIKHGAPLNTYNKEKLTPLHIAINNGNAKLVKYLIEQGANINAETNNKLLPIHLALMSKYEVCKDNIIPKEIGEIEKKEKNELNNAILNKIIEIFPKKYYDEFTVIFDTYFNSIADWKKFDYIINEITEIQSNSSFNIDEIKKRIDEKKEEYIIQLAKQFNNDNVKYDNKKVDIITSFESETKINNDPNIQSLLDKYNYANIDKKIFLKTNITNISNNLVSELIKYYQGYYGKKLLFKILNKSEYKAKYTFNINDILNIDIRELTGMDFKSKNELFINESGNKIRYYNYNYRSNDEALLCYKNNKDIVLYLIDQPSTNYFVRDSNNNTILHYLVNIENIDIFTEVYKDKFKKLKELKNNNGKMPIDLLKEKRDFNNKNFYKIENSVINREELLFSEIFSDELYIKLKNNNELNSNLPTKIKNIFNDIYVIFNLENINVDMFRTGSKDKYDLLFNFTKDSKWSLSAEKDLNISDETYNFLQKRHDIKDIYMNNNDYLKRYYNTLIHVLTLHVSNVYYHLMYKFLLESNISKIGSTKQMLEDFKKVVFDYDPTFEKPNLAQMIIINLYKIKFSEIIIPNKSLSSLKSILKLITIKLDNNIIESKKTEYLDQNDKITDYLTIYFESFNKKITLFLTNYVKFIELQYNLQKMHENLQKN